MDIGSVSMNLNQIQLSEKVSMAVTKMVMSTEQNIGEKMNDMLDNIAVDSSKGVNIDAFA